jgi:Sec-independent protein secretion pathway component TatC
MGFLEHLDELRTRVTRSCVALGIGMLVVFLFVDRLATFVLAPTLRMLPPGTTATGQRGPGRAVVSGHAPGERV